MKSQALLRLCSSASRQYPALCTAYQVERKHPLVKKFVFHFQSRRWISLHEYQSKKILQENNLNVQRFQVVENPQDAKRAGEELSTHLRRHRGLVNNCFSFSENHRERISYQSASLSWWSW